MLYVIQNIVFFSARLLLSLRYRVRVEGLDSIRGLHGTVVLPNHPAYIDWCDEATSRRMVASGLDPVLLRPIAEQVTFRSSVLPGERVIVRSKRVGMIGSDAVVLRHHLETERGPAADATSVRALADGSGEALISAWG